MEEEAAQSFLYETLSPLSLTDEKKSSPYDDPEPYSVFRNKISLSTLNDCPTEAAAPDFFSLDIGADNSEKIPPSPFPATPKLVARESEPVLERGWFRGNSRFRSPMLQLHKEIVDFCEFLSPTPEEQASRNRAVESVFHVVKHIWPHCNVEVFGSFKTGLYLPTSDIDVVILGSGIPNPQLGLRALSRALSEKGVAKKIQVIGKARVPIIKFVERKSGIAFDLSFDVENGPKAADFIKDIATNWPPLRPLCLILKVFLQQRELNEVYSGGIGSYALLTMLLAMLQSHYGCQSPEQNLGILLVHFFDMYGRKLNTSDVGVSCNGGGTFFSKSSRGFLNQARPFLISIEDPQAPENDIGKNSFNYYQIRSAFSMAYTTLTNPKIITALGPTRSILGTIIRPDRVLLERKGGSQGGMTFNTLLPGAGEPIQSQYDDPQQILCNWQFDEEEPLPRGKGAVEDSNTPSSGKKRKSSSKDRSGKKKIKANGKVGKVISYGENGSSKEKGSKKKRGRRSRDDDDRSRAPKA